MPNLTNAETGETLLNQLEVADSFWKRFVGLMFRKSLPIGFGIWIKPCKSVHTMWMRIPIDIHFLDRNNTVISFRKNVRPWRVAMAPKNTHSVVETKCGTIEIPMKTRIESS
jgi:uncharacterized membrane protein (UPF0127 family)